MNLKHLEVTKELHTAIKTAAAEQSTSMRAVTERLLRLGTVAPELAMALRGIVHIDDWDDFDEEKVVLAAYDAALKGKEMP